MTPSPTLQTLLDAGVERGWSYPERLLAMRQLESEAPDTAHTFRRQIAFIGSEAMLGPEHVQGLATFLEADPGPRREGESKLDAVFGRMRERKAAAAAGSTRTRAAAEPAEPAPAAESAADPALEQAFRQAVQLGVNINGERVTADSLPATATTTEQASEAMTASEIGERAIKDGLAVIYGGACEPAEIRVPERVGDPEKLGWSRSFDEAKKRGLVA